jgi:hypothetical protein
MQASSGTKGAFNLRLGSWDVVAPAPLQGAAVDPGTGGGGGSVPPRSRGSRSGSGEAAGVGAVRRRLNPRREKEEEEENGWAGRLRGRV